MKKFFIKLFAATILMQLTIIGQGFADEPVRVTSDGKIVDIDGNVTAIQNHDDSRNNDYEKYYMSVDADGNGTGKSTFYVVSDLSKGYVRKEIPITVAENQPQDPPVFDFSSLVPPSKITNQNTANPNTTAQTTTTVTPSATTTNAAQQNLVYRRNVGGRIITTTRPNRQPTATTTTTTAATNQNNTAATNHSQNSAPVSSQKTVDAPTRASSNDAVYGNVNNAQTLYGH